MISRYYILPWVAPLLTVVVETGFFALVGYRKPLFLLLCVAVNVATNLTINMIANWIGWYSVFEWWVLFAELCVVALEYLAYALALGRSIKLFWLTFAANALSFLAGELLVWI